MKPLEGRRPKARAVLLAMVGIVIVAVTLFRVPLATVFGLGVLLICPLLMVGMHGGGHTDGHNTSAESAEIRTGPLDRPSDAGSDVSSAPPLPPDVTGGRSANDQRREVQS